MSKKYRTNEPIFVGVLVIGYWVLGIGYYMFPCLLWTRKTPRQSANHGTLDRIVHPCILHFTNRRGARAPVRVKAKRGPTPAQLTANRGARRSVAVTASRDCTVPPTISQNLGFFIPRLDPALLQDPCDSHVAGGCKRTQRALLLSGRFLIARALLIASRTGVHTHTRESARYRTSEPHL
jgi:hypothetical protein